MEKYGQKLQDKFYQSNSSLPDVTGISATAEVRSFLVLRSSMVKHTGCKRKSTVSSCYLLFVSSLCERKCFWGVIWRILRNRRLIVMYHCIRMLKVTPRGLSWQDQAVFNSQNSQETIVEDICPTLAAIWEAESISDVKSNFSTMLVLMRLCPIFINLCSWKKNALS